jgi:two-component system, NtrC family, sensor kinase
VALSIPGGTLASADPGPLSQVLINLLINAAQAMEGKGRIELRTETVGSRVLLHVEDEGPGLPPEAQRQLFQPFFTTKERGGTGLGLAISLHLVKAMGGELRAQNREHGGARFTVELPAPPLAP